MTFVALLYVWSAYFILKRGKNIWGKIALLISVGVSKFAVFPWGWITAGSAIAFFLFLLLITAEELTDFAFGMLTVFAELSLVVEGDPLFSAIDADDASPVFTTISAKFAQQYPMLTEPLAVFSSTEDFLGFYHYGEAVVPTKTTPGYGSGMRRSLESLASAPRSAPHGHLCVYGGLGG